MPQLEWGSLARAEITDAFANGALAAMAVGALEQHGDHLPTDTDTFLAQAVLAEAAQRTSLAVVLLPALPFGFSPYHARFGGTISLGSDTLLRLLRDVCDSVRTAGAEHLLLLNGHGGNEGPLRIVGHETSDHEFAVIVTSYWELAATAARDIFTEDNGHFGHAGQFETSLLMALRPECVGHTSDAFEPVRQVIRPPTIEQLGDSGVIGDPRAASSALGTRFHTAVVEGLTSFLNSFSRDRLALQ